MSEGQTPNKCDFYLVLFPGPLSTFLPPTVAPNRGSVKNGEGGVYLVTYHPVLSLLGVTCQKVTFLLLLVPYGSLSGPLLGIPGNYSRQDARKAGCKLILSPFYDEQIPINSRDPQFCICAKAKASGGTKAIKRGACRAKVCPQVMDS